MTKRIFNEASPNKMQDVRVRDLEYSNLYADITVLNMREQFMNDEEFIKHLAQLLNLNLQIVKKKGDK